MSTTSALIFASLVVYTASIGVPLNPMISRCMIAYTDDNY